MPFGQELNILNQRQTPAWFADTFANRPNFGFAGRMFISTDTQEIWRDTGTGWILIAAAGIGAITASNGVTISGNDVRLGGSLTGNTTISGNFGITLSQGFLRTNFITANPTDGVTGGGFAQTITPTADVTGVTNVYGGVDILTINLASAKITTPSATNISAGLSSLVLQNSNGQSTGVIAAHRAALTSVNNVNAADVRLYNAKTPEYSGAGASIANLYGMYIEAQKSAAVTNAWGIYQAGANDLNYLNGALLLGTTTDAGFKLDVNGTARATSYTLGNYIINQASANQFIVSNPAGSSGQLFLYGGTTSQANIQIYGSSGGNTNNILFNVGSTVRAVIFGSTGNVGINTTTDAGFKLDVNGTARVQGNTNIGGFISATNYIECRGQIFLRATGGGSHTNFTTDASNMYIGQSNAINLQIGYTGTYSFILDNSNRIFGLSDNGTAASTNASSLLTLSSTTRGFLMPRMTGAQAEAIATPAAGLLIYANNGNGVTITTTGWWGYDGATWVKLN